MASVILHRTFISEKHQNNVALRQLRGLLFTGTPRWSCVFWHTAPRTADSHLQLWPPEGNGEEVSQADMQYKKNSVQRIHCRDGTWLIKWTVAKSSETSTSLTFPSAACWSTNAPMADFSSLKPEERTRAVCDSLDLVRTINHLSVKFHFTRLHHDLTACHRTLLTLTVNDLQLLHPVQRARQ